MNTMIVSAYSHELPGWSTGMVDSDKTQETPYVGQVKSSQEKVQKGRDLPLQRIPEAHRKSHQVFKCTLKAYEYLWKKYISLRTFPKGLERTMTGLHAVLSQLEDCLVQPAKLENLLIHITEDKVPRKVGSTG